MKRLAGQIAVVAGATRGAGRGVARMLGEAGATVYCTGRSSEARRGPSKRAETIEETAELVNAAGGTGIAVRVDHNVEAEVVDLFARVERERGRLDVLVNVLGGPEAEWGGTFWTQPLERARAHLEGWLWTHLVTVRHAAPMMIARSAGLIVELTEHDTLGYRGSLFYDLARVSALRMAYGVAEDVTSKGITCVALTPGFMRTEAVLDHFGVKEANWREAADTPAGKQFLLSASETPCLVGRAVVALATDANVRQKSGGLFSSWGLAEEYGLDDMDGSRPNWGEAYAEYTGELQIGKSRWEWVDNRQMADAEESRP
jgi:NAD(P)-dependent dehydrogenase (short-subunit alcohol dehydrogenase family)